MPSTRLLDGKAVADQIKQEIRSRILDLKARGIQPGLAAVLVGEDPASRVYVGSKVRTCQELGIKSAKLELSGNTGTGDLLAVVERLNRDETWDGILIQLPLPKQVDSQQVLSAVNPEKDVDGFHPVNVGKLCIGQESLTPCTPAGIVELLQRNQLEIEGRRAVILGRSNIVGKPLALMLLKRHATVTLCHSRTRELPAVTREADILVAAMGKPGFVTADFVRPGAVVIDVGMNRITDPDLVHDYFGTSGPRVEQFKRRGSALIGDVHPRSVDGVAGYLTPVPGGVGPLTIAMLMSNTVKAAMLRRGLW